MWLSKERKTVNLVLWKKPEHQHLSEMGPYSSISCVSLKNKDTVLYQLGILMFHLKKAQLKLAKIQMKFIGLSVLPISMWSKGSNYILRRSFLDLSSAFLHVMASS